VHCTIEVRTASCMELDGLNEEKRMENDSPSPMVFAISKGNLQTRTHRDTWLSDDMNKAIRRSALWSSVGANPVVLLAVEIDAERQSH
jgi:hypothetical protein